jgi:hypothetical protein
MKGPNEGSGSDTKIEKKLPKNVANSSHPVETNERREGTREESGRM